MSSPNSLEEYEKKFLSKHPKIASQLELQDFEENDQHNNNPLHSDSATNHLFSEVQDSVSHARARGAQSQFATSPVSFSSPPKPNYAANLHYQSSVDPHSGAPSSQFLAFKTTGEKALPQVSDYQAYLQKANRAIFPFFDTINKFRNTQVFNVAFTLVATAGLLAFIYNEVYYYSSLKKTGQKSGEESSQEEEEEEDLAKRIVVLQYEDHFENEQDCAELLDKLAPDVVVIGGLQKTHAMQIRRCMQDRLGYLKFSSLPSSNPVLPRDEPFLSGTAIISRHPFSKFFKFSFQDTHPFVAKNQDEEKKVGPHCYFEINDGKSILPMVSLSPDLPNLLGFNFEYFHSQTEQVTKRLEQDPSSGLVVPKNSEFLVACTFTTYFQTTNQSETFAQFFRGKTIISAFLKQGYIFSSRARKCTQDFHANLIFASSDFPKDRIGRSANWVKIKDQKDYTWPFVIDLNY